MRTKCKVQMKIDMWEGKINILVFCSRSMKKCGDVNKRASGRDGSSKCRQMVGKACTRTVDSSDGSGYSYAGTRRLFTRMRLVRCYGKLLVSYYTTNHGFVKDG